MLPAGSSQIRQVFMAQTGPNPYLSLLTYLFFFAMKYRIVCVTHDAVHVFKASIFKPSFPKELELSLPRDRYFGEVSGLWAKVMLDRETWVHKRFHKDVRAADQELAQQWQAQPGHRA